MKNVYYVGLDVHKETVEMSVFLNMNKEPEFEKRVENNQSKLYKILNHLQEKGYVKVCYEAGSSGFVLKRFFDDSGIECSIVSPGKIPRKPGERIKTDRRDARILAKLLRSGEAESIYVPTREDEAARDYIRARDDIQNDLKRGKHQLLKFLLRNGYKYSSGTYWAASHRRWMKGLEFNNGYQKETFEIYYTRIIELEERLALMDEKIVELANSEQYREKVGILRCFNGIDYLTALAFVCEIGDFRRFPRAESFMAYLGLVPREHSSGDKRHLGAITKAGNSHLRRLIVEAGWHYRHRSVPGKRLTARRAGQKTEIIAYADKAMRRLHKKFNRLSYKGKPSNVIVIAVARELAGFIWGAMNNNIVVDITLK